MRRSSPQVLFTLGLCWFLAALGAFAVFVGFQVNWITEWSFGNQMVVILVWVTLGITLALGRIAGKEAL